MVRRLITTVVVALMPFRALCDVNRLTTVQHDEPRAAAAHQLRI